MLLGATIPPGVAASCLHAAPEGYLSGTFDDSGRVCITQPVLSENVVTATLYGTRSAQLLDARQQRWRQLVKRGPAEGVYTLLFALPVRQASTLVLEGRKGDSWSMRWQIRETVPLERQQTLAPVSPTLQRLARQLDAGGATE